MDKAQPNPRHIQSVWGGSPHCVLSGRRGGWVDGKAYFIDMAHVLSRGQLFGIKPDSPERKYFSSIFAVVPLEREIHNGAFRDTVEMRHLFLDIAYQAVQYQIALGNYTMKEHDRHFLKYAYEWCEDNPCRNPIPHLYSTVH